MLKEAIQEIVRLAGPKVFELEGESFASQNLVRIEPKKDFPEKLTLTGLDSVCKLIRNEANTCSRQTRSWCRWKATTP